jgi:hypothetical protein
MGADQRIAELPRLWPDCARCGRALSTDWVRKHLGAMGGVPVCNCCRAPQVPLRPVRLDYWDAPYPESVEPMSGSIWSDRFLGGDE